MIKVLVVDDSALMRKYLRCIFQSTGGFEVVTARNGVDALAQVVSEQPDVVTLDINMPEMDGITCLGHIMAEAPRPVLMLSSLTDSAARVTFEALELGAVDFITKPGGTVSLNLGEASGEIVAKTRAAARAKVRRAGTLADRLRRQRERADEQAARRPTSVRSSAFIEATTSLVLIGASTGGPAVLPAIIGALPASFPAPIVIAQHIPANFSRHLANRIDAAGPLAAEEVTARVDLHPGHVYLGRGDADLVVGRRQSGLTARAVPLDSDRRWHPSVSRLVESALEVVAPAEVVAVELTGMGDDGAEEMARLRSLGGRTIAESADSAVVWGMPGELVRLGGATKVLPVADIAEQLLGWI